MTDFYLSYSLLVKDFQEICEYIAPHVDNYNTYSHRTYELLLRNCTEFENLCKYLIRIHDIGNNPRTIEDYHAINAQFNLHEYEIGLGILLPQKEKVFNQLNTFSFYYLKKII